MNIKQPTLVGKLVRLRPMNYENDHIAWFEASQDENMHLCVGNTIPKTYEEVKEQQ